MTDGADCFMRAERLKFMLLLLRYLSSALGELNCTLALR